MAIAPAQQRTVGRALVASAAAMFALGFAFWQGLFGMTEDARALVTGGLALVGLTDLGLGIYFLRSSK